MPLPATIPLTPPGRPFVPLAPVLSRASFGRGRASLRGVLDAGPAQLVTSGRVALALALRELGVSAGDTVLLPAYHSLSMVPPVLWRGAAPAFYRVGMDTKVDLDDVAARLGPRVKVLVVTHYFGFPQDLSTIRAFCDAHGLALVEDCAHCFFGEHAGRPVGSFGDYAIASSMKFFPAYDGGVLVSNRRPLALAMRPAGPGFEIKALLNTLELGFTYGRLPLLRALLAAPLAAKDLLWRALKSARPQGAPALAPASSESGVEFDPAWIDKPASWIARRLLRRASGARIVAQRRANYLRLERTLGQLPGCRPLFDRLPEGACPWLFPLLVDDPEPAFARLCAWGVPVTRFASTLWPGVDAATCASSAALSRRVLAFPVHQELLEHELAWLCERARAALTP
ncbi:MULTISPECIES: DegT/DnrJ/EryC1/StrS family aminotransferase [unclassified Massilia]|uniref:DegT/DnrJ/EryC1/StrS family aminotransferase n=1 Tax=unclassified Massilia TaxID=2609279 RepID=UPI001785D7DE|nr:MULTISPECIES: DegT/DnrJ/EryC1/StrS family aminotransferase [unclassified Massilia]MBD8531337.1 DegT/DnrJ/EryC1/StrS aminotransferase family protein [Massilia sp. CFBP 13647]MBD8674408.1 DegT/DnrJ/EryC1/StrS aminotransferase family protein [Massilia sp. CFBP 13721]